MHMWHASPANSREKHGTREELGMIADRSHIHTELVNAGSQGLDALGVEEAVALMNAEDAKAVAAVGRRARRSRRRCGW